MRLFQFLFLGGRIIRRHNAIHSFDTPSIQYQLTILKESAKTGANRSEDEGNFELEETRKYLESSWNKKTMGNVPSTPESAAVAASASVESAVKDGKNKLMIDILLPAYDITQGNRLYDEILAAQFCIQLADNLSNSRVAPFSTILVKDGKSERFVRRVIDKNDTNKGKDKSEMIENGEDNTQQKEIGNASNTQQTSDSPFDDDLDGIGLTSAGFGSDDAELFRQNLLSSWNQDIDATTFNNQEGKADDSTPLFTQTPNSFRDSKSCFRIGSLLGDEKISGGSDMTEDVINAVDKQNSCSDADAIIILSAISREEMIAIRRILELYDEKKIVILVNCKLTPTPRELLRAEMAYSLLPLVLVEKQQQTASVTEKEQTKTRVVVLRRYPQGWQVFVDMDDGEGFNLAGSTESITDPKGPSMDRIAGCVKRFLSSKLASQEQNDALQ